MVRFPQVYQSELFFFDYVDFSFYTFIIYRICNPTTAFVWEQLISNIKPKLEVNRKRKIIIINRLTKKSLIKQVSIIFTKKNIDNNQ